MEDTLISFETAKLAKEKGFNWKTYYYYNLDSKLNDESTILDRVNGMYNHKFQGGNSAPTQSFLQKWLREKHKIHVQILPYNHKYLISLLKYGQNGSNPNFDEEHSTYEEALEIGLQEALKLIK